MLYQPAFVVQAIYCFNHLPVYQNRGTVGIFLFPFSILFQAKSQWEFDFMQVKF